MPHYYGVLGIATDADSAQVKTAFRSLAKTCHPDLRGGDGEHFREIILAYETLADPARRAAYDALQAPGASLPPPSRPWRPHLP